MFVLHLITTLALLAALLASADGFVTPNKVAFAVGHHSSTQPLPLSRPVIRKSMIQKAEPQDIVSSTESSPSKSSSPLDKPVLAVLDLVALLVFAGVGKASHATDGSLDLLAVGITAFPFMISWLATSFFTGVYGPIDSQKWLQSSFQQTLQGWIVAIPLGCVGRGLIKGYVPPTPFVIVTMIATLVMLGLTRTAYHYFVTVEKEQAN
jgi:hypothetical protein